MHRHHQEDHHEGHPKGSSTRQHDILYESNSSEEEQLALLQYLLDHNRHHAEEIAGIAKGFDNKNAELLLKAVVSYQEGNDKVEAFLKSMQSGGQDVFG